MAMGQQATPALVESSDDHQVALSPFGHSDRDFAFDPLSTNRRLTDHADLLVLATVVFAGPTPDTIHVISAGGIGGVNRFTTLPHAETWTGD